MKRVLGAFISFFVLAIVFSGCTVNFGGSSNRGVSIDLGTEMTEKDNISENASGTTELNISNGVGDINLKPTDGDVIKISAVKKVKGKDEKQKKEVIDNIKMNVSKDGQKLIVDVKTRDNAQEDFWKWLENKFKSLSAQVVINIEVPNNIKVFAIHDGVGDITLEKLDGSVEIESGVGDVELKNVSLRENSKIHSGTGDIVMDVNIDKIDGLTVENGVGKISMTVPENSGFKLEAKTGVGNITGNLLTAKTNGVGGSMSLQVNGGGPSIKLTTGTGSIRVDKK